MTELTREQIEAFRIQARYLDQSTITGERLSDQVCNLAIAALEGGEVWLADFEGRYHKFYASEKAAIDDISKFDDPDGWTVRRFRLVPVEG